MNRISAFRLSALALAISLAAAAPAAPPYPGMPPGTADELLPGFEPGKSFSGGVDDVNLYSGDPNVAIPLGPVFSVGGGATWRLSARYTSKIWNDFDVPIDYCTGYYVGYAYLGGLPYAGAGWTIDLGWIGLFGSSEGEGQTIYSAPDGAKHRFTRGDAAYAYAEDGSNLRLRQLSDQTFELTFPNGTVHEFRQPYQRPLPAPPATGVVDFNDDPYRPPAPGWEIQRQTRYGLTRARDAYGAVQLEVTYEGTKPWQFRSVTLTQLQGRKIEFTWDEQQYAGTDGTGNAVRWPVIRTIAFPPGPGGTRTITFAHEARNLKRNSYDLSRQPSGVQGCNWNQTPATAPVPLLASITSSGGGPTETYSFAYVQEQPDTQYQYLDGLLSYIKLPTGAEIRYEYGRTAGPGAPRFGTCTDIETDSFATSCQYTQPSGEPNGARQSVPERLRLKWDRSAAVTRRRVFEPLASSTCGRSSDPTLDAACSTTYVRHQYTYQDESDSLALDEKRTLRRVVVTGPDGNATRHVFYVGAAGGGRELLRRRYAGSDITLPPVRSETFCHQDGQQYNLVYPNLCWIRETAGIRNGQIALPTPNSLTFDFGHDVSLSKSLTWYGASPEWRGGKPQADDCSRLPSVPCWQSALSDYDPAAREFRLETRTTTSDVLRPVGGGPDRADPWLRREVRTTWIPQTGAWLLKLVSSIKTTDHYSSGTCPTEVAPCEVETLYDNDLTTGRLRSTAVGPVGTRVTRTFYTTPACSSHPADPCREVATGDFSGAGEFTTSRTFSGGLLVTSSRLDWKTFDVTRDQYTGLVTSSRDPDLRTTTYQYDGQGRLTTITPAGSEVPTTIAHMTYAGPLGETLRYALVKRDPGDPTGASDDAGTSADNIVDAYQYDGLGRLVRHVRKLPNAFSTGSRLSFQETRYDTAGRKVFVSEWTPCAGTSTRPVDCFTSSASHATTFGGFDVFGRATRVTLADQSVTTYGFDDPEGVTASDFSQTETRNVGCPVPQSCPVKSGLRRDFLGRPSVALDPGVLPASGALAGFTPIPGRVVSRHNAFDKLSYLQHDGDGNVVQARGFTYDARGFLLKEVHPEKGRSEGAIPGIVTYSNHDALGNARRMADNVATVDTTFDAMGRVLTVTSGGLTYASDVWDAPGGKGKLSERRASDVVPYPGALFERFYYGGATGRLERKDTGAEFLVYTPVTGPFVTNASVLYAYDKLGQLANEVRQQASDPLSLQTEYSNGYPTAVRVNGAPLVTGVTYDPSGALALYQSGLPLGPQAQTTLAQDANLLARPKSIQTTGSTAPFSTGDYSYDGAGNILYIGPDVFAYDARSRLTSAVLSGFGQQSYTYNPFGAMLTKTGMNGTTYQVDPSTSQLQSFAGSAVTYSNRGELVSAAGKSYGYDALGRQVSFTAPGISYRYLYAADGERYSKSNASGEEVTFHRDPANRVASEYWNGSRSRENVYLGSLLVASIESGTYDAPGVKYYASDHLGTPRLKMWHGTDALGGWCQTRI